VQLGRVNPIVINLENASQATNLSGDLVLRYNETEYVTRLELPTPSKKRFVTQSSQSFLKRCLILLTLQQTMTKRRKRQSFAEGVPRSPISGQRELQFSVTLISHNFRVKNRQARRLMPSTFMFFQNVLRNSHNHCNLAVKKLVNVAIDRSFYLINRCSQAA
jgi:hypothetical protein